MMSSKLKVGGECVSYCTKCRRDTVHRIIAMLAGVPVKVECESCHSHHKYRRPMEERAADERRAAAATAGSRARSPAAPARSPTARAIAEAAEEAEREKLWASKIAGKGTGDFLKYSPKASFKEHDLVQHFKFGDGFVVRIIDANKIEVLFRDGPRVLAQGL